MDELRAASNQVELERVQRNLARLQRLGDKHGSLVTGLEKQHSNTVFKNL